MDEKKSLLKLDCCIVLCTQQVERVEELVGGGSPDVSYMDNEKRSPLHAAAFVGNSDIVEILISQVRRAFVLVDF